MPTITHLRHGKFPSRYGATGNRGALYGLKAPITVADLRKLTAAERELRGIPRGISGAANRARIARLESRNG